MAGSHKVRVSQGGSWHRFEVTARPERCLSRVPILGPFFTYNLGRNPRFVVEVKHLGYSLGDEDNLDPEILPAEGTWEFDLVLMVNGAPMTHSEDLVIDLTKKKQRIVTGPWPLTRPGSTELQVGPLQIEYTSLFSFEIMDNTVTAANWVFGLFIGVAGGVIGAVLTRLASND